MKLPRWTVYPALAVIGIFLVVALPNRREDPYEGAAEAARAGAPRPAEHKRVVVLGIDGMDPEFLADVIERYPDRMPNFRRIVKEGGIHPLGTSNPPQSPVAWSNFITGRNPGGHGIFDFIHRDPVTRGPAGSTTKAVEPSAVGVPFTEYKLPLTGDPESNRTGESFWVTLARKGIPADIWRMPANFPVEPAKGLSFPGMMTPTLDSAYGEFTFFTTDYARDKNASGGHVQEVQPAPSSPDLLRGRLRGPLNVFLREEEQATVEVKFHIDRENQAVAVEVGDEVVVLEPGQWSDFVPVNFDLLPMGMMGLGGVVRFYLKSLEPEFELYASPVNFDPENPATPVSEPNSAAADVAQAIGTYYTQGMAEEVNALKDRVLTDPEFMQQVELVYRERRRMLDFALDRYLEDNEGGLLFFYFSTVDLASHMMWRHADPEHPHHDPEFAARDSSRWTGRPGSTWKDVLDDLYLRMDPVLERVRQRVGEDALILVMSDHGFAPYHRKFSLNAWLQEEGYLVLKEGETRELAKSDPKYSQKFITSVVDWSKTRAYGMGFNGLYLNLKGREGLDPKTGKPGLVQKGEDLRKWWNGLTAKQQSEMEKPEFVDVFADEGVVDPAQADALLREIQEKLERIVDPKTGLRVITDAALAKEIYSGERLAEAPDMLVGFNAGYGNSDASSTGRVPHHVLEDNLGGTFNGNHLMDPAMVPGILLANRPIPGEGHRLLDLTVEILKQYGITPGEDLEGRPIFN